MEEFGISQFSKIAIGRRHVLEKYAMDYEFLSSIDWTLERNDVFIKSSIMSGDVYILIERKGLQLNLETDILDNAEVNSTFLMEIQQLLNLGAHFAIVDIKDTLWVLVASYDIKPNLVGVTDLFLVL
jgi:hypothetical protein